MSRLSVGSLIMAGFPGLEAPPDFLERVRTGRVGGAVLFGRNVESPAQVKALTTSLQDAARAGGQPPLLIGIDHEGGNVQRLRTGVTRLPSQMAVASSGRLDLAADLYRQAARELRAMGINMNFAPVLDVNNNPSNPVIGTRAFSHRPEEVVRFGIAAIQAWQEGGVIACGKHFPGHGDTAEDSHLTLPLVPHDRDRLDAVELLPFREAIAAGLRAIMTAHVQFPAIEPNGLPATLSRRVLTGLMREELGFSGIIATDSLEMQAIQKTAGTVAGAVAAVLAGADLCLISHTAAFIAETFDALDEAVRHGGIPVHRVEDALRRLEAVRSGLGPDAPPPSPAPALEAALFGQAVHQAGEAQNLPLREPARLVSFRAPSQTEAEDLPSRAGAFVAGLAALGLVAEHHQLPTNPDSTAINGVLGGDERLPLVVVWDRAWRFPGQRALVERAVDNRTVYVVALTSPFDLQSLPPGVVGLTAFDPTESAQAALAEALAGSAPLDPIAF
jgi:beta-N-acetylhexosaminidase